MKTASRILGSAFFEEGYEVQDAPRYGAERRGAPIFAYVRAAQAAIDERGIIDRPDLVIVADDSLVAIPAAGVLAGADKHTVLLILSNEDATTWHNRLNFPGQVLILPETEEIEDPLERRYGGASCAGAAARMVGVISKQSLELAIQDEIATHGTEVVEKNLRKAIEAFEAIADYDGLVKPGSEVSAEGYQSPRWTELPFEDARLSAPDIFAGATSMQVNTGLWRTMRPIIEYDRCSRCWWVCSTFCPDGAINVLESGKPQIDYDHCKGCMVCVAQCPPHAIVAIPEHVAQEQENAEVET
jgi:pyruvate ferredoxin oxidoreductase gamma subunit